MPGPMTNGSTVVEQKLQELESHVHQMLSSSTSPTYHDMEDIKKLTIVLKDLFSAELAASCPPRPQHLIDIARRITNLESVVSDACKYYNIPVHHDEDDPSSTLITASTAVDSTNASSPSSCSCNENDHDGDGALVVRGNYDENTGFTLYDNPEFISNKDDEFGDGEPMLMLEACDGGNHQGDEAWEEAWDDVMDEMRSKKNIVVDHEYIARGGEDEVGVGGENNGFPYWRVLARGMMLGVVMTGLFMVSFTGCFHSSDPAFFVPPT